MALRKNKEWEVWNVTEAMARVSPLRTFQLRVFIFFFLIKLFFLKIIFYTRLKYKEFDDTELCATFFKIQPNRLEIQKGGFQKFQIKNQKNFMYLSYL